MKRMWRHRLTAWVLSSIMAISAIPITVQAEQIEDGYTEEVTVQEVESEGSEAEGENALKESEQPKAGGQDEDEGTPENETEVKYIETEIENAYQFGDSPTGQEVAVYARARSSNEGIEDYLYQQIQRRVEEVDLSAYKIGLVEEECKKITNIIGGILNEHAEFYFVKKKFTYSGSNGIATKVKITYDDSLDNEKFQLEVNKALSVVNAGMSDLEKAIVLHDYIAINCEYDKERLDNKTMPDISYTAYGVFVGKIAVCEGYALAYKYLLNQLGIECYMVTSDSMNHAWNLIQLNGKYYQVDVTWDDPVFDRLGRVRHWYMFRSDDAFKTITKQHSNWQVTSGSTVVDYQATDIQYDNAFWINCDSQMAITEHGCYYMYSSKSSSENAIKKASLSNVSGTNTTIVENVGVWRDWNSSSSYWPGVYSGLLLVDGRLYYNTPNEVRSVALDGSDGRSVFTPDTSTGYIYGIALRDGELAYCLHQSPNLSEKETVMYSGIKIPANLPTDIPVTGITLDQNSLTLVKGGTAVLQATVSPSDATDRTVVWSSSNGSVATVSDGRVTAVGAGNCTITASAGEKSTSCNVRFFLNFGYY